MAPTTALDFFRDPRVQFPLERTEDDFEGYVRKRLEAYTEFIREMEPRDSITIQISNSLSKIEELAKSIEEAIREYLRGLPHKAYSCLSKGIEYVRSDELPLFISPQVNHPFSNEMYRMRRAEDHGLPFKRSDLFHIPFQLRHKVTRQRFSIPGLPCLYLGGSSYICWEELGRPAFESVHVSRFKIADSQSIGVLDFMQRPLHVAFAIEKNSETANGFSEERNGYVAFAILWPLMSTAAIRRKERDAPFVPEYIIPQLILQWITQNKELDGIAYSAVSCRTHTTYPALIANLVFPAKDVSHEGYCKQLCRKFAMSEPVAWHLLERLQMSSSNPLAAEEELELIPGVRAKYSATAFGSIEGKLLSMEARGLG